MNIPVRNGQIARALYRSIRNGQAIDNIPGLVKQVIREEMWHSLVIEETGELVEFSSFEQFVKTPPPEGIGASLDTIERLCRDDREAVDLITQVTRRQPGNPTGANQYTNGIVDNIHNSTKDRPDGTSKQAGLRRLRKLETEGNQQAATLRKRVLANELSVNAALVELKLRPKTITIPADPAKAASVIKRHFSAEDIERLIEELR